MAGSLIDWSAVQPAPTQPNSSLGSISEMLQAFAERRSREQQAKVAQQQAEQHFQAQMAEKLADNARAEQYHKDELAMQRDQQAATEAHRKAEMDVNAGKEAAAVLPQIQDAQAAGDTTGVQNLAALHGGQVIDKPQQQSPLVGLPRELGLAMNMGTGDMQTKPMPPPGQQLRLAGRVLDLPSKGEMEATHAAAAKQRSDQFLAQVGPVARTGNGQRALAETMAQMNAPTWDPKEDPFKTFQARMQNLEGQDVTMAGHRMANAHAGAGESHKLTTEGLSERRGLRSELSTWKKDAHLSDINKAWEEMNRAEAMSKSGSGAAQAAAVESFIKAARGGAVTGASQAFMGGHMGGLIDGLETNLEKAKSGGYAPGQMAVLTRGIRDAREAIKESVEAHRKDFVDKYYSGEYDGVKANIDNEYAGLFGHFGYKTDRQPGTAGIDAKGHAYSDKGVPKADEGGVRKMVNGKPAIVYPDGSYEEVK